MIAVIQTERKIKMDYRNQIEIYNAINAGFGAFAKLARANLRRNWVTIPLHQRCAAARGLVKMNAVIGNAEKYFAPKYTRAEWDARAAVWCAKNNIDSKLSYNAYYVVPGPAEMLYSAVLSAFCGKCEIGQQYYNFCRAIQEWEYGRASSHKNSRNSADYAALEILDASRRVGTMARLSNRGILSLIAQKIRGRHLAR